MDDERSGDLRRMVEGQVEVRDDVVPLGWRDRLKLRVRKDPTLWVVLPVVALIVVGVLMLVGDDEGGCACRVDVNVHIKTDSTAVAPTVGDADFLYEYPDSCDVWF